MMSLSAFPWEIGSPWVERVGQEEMGEFAHRMRWLKNGINGL